MLHFLCTGVWHVADQQATSIGVIVKLRGIVIIIVIFKCYICPECT